MTKDKYVFAQLIEFLGNNKFRYLVDKYDGNRYVKHFTCWNQLLAMMFGQLCNRESLRRHHSLISSKGLISIMSKYSIVLSFQGYLINI